MTISRYHHGHRLRKSGSVSIGISREAWLSNYSDMWRDPDRDNAVLMACDAKYQWMALAACTQARKFRASRCDLEVWSWGGNKFCDRVWRGLYALDARICQVPDTGQYCAGGRLATTRCVSRGIVAC